MRVIPQEVKDLKSVVAAVLDPAGVLLEANAGFMDLLGTSPARRIGANVALLFTKPAFTDLATAKASEGGEIHRGTLGFIGADGQALELPGSAWRTAFGICVVAEYDVEALRKAGHKRDSGSVAQRELRYVEASLTDALTGTGTRERLDQALGTEISRVRRSGLPLSAMMAGVDGFDQICEQHGQASCDKLLTRFGYLLRLLTRPTDVPARFDAERFVVLLPHTSLDQAGAVARRLDNALGTQKIDSIEGPVGATFGIAQFIQGEDAVAFLRRLQGAVAKAQQSPGDTVGVATV